MKIVFTKPEMQEMIMKHLESSMGVHVKDKVLVISIHNASSDYLVINLQDKNNEGEGE